MSRFENELHFEHIAVTLNTMLDHIERFKKAVVHQASQLCKDNRILKEHNAELEDFLKIITHDLKSPLCTIEMLCDALMEQEAIKKSEYLDNVRILEENVAHLRKLVDDLLEYSLIGSHDENHQTVDVTALVGELFETFSPQVQQIGAKIYIAEPLPPLHGSYVQITHVFSNLITNALKYRSEKPLEISITGEKNNEYVHYTVRDNGSGIMPEICGKIFAVCFRGNVNAFPQGTGVGLSIVKKIVKNHGGRVWAESKGHNQGAAFHMLFPNGDRK
ncbi:hypothetical protein KDK77_02955 [bacterium]|nr:hypothetical protein [bacterium]MCP5462512.1 hypothetical protein [bacterium]